MLWSVPRSFQVLDPPQRLSYSWEALEPSPTTITFELIAENGGTRLRLTHTGIGEGEDWDSYYTSVSLGWGVHLNHLTVWLETGISETPGPTGSMWNLENSPEERRNQERMSK